MDLPETIFGVTRRRFEQIITTIDTARKICESPEDFEASMTVCFDGWADKEIFVAGYALGLEVMSEMNLNPIIAVLSSKHAYDGKFTDDNNQPKKQKMPDTR